MANVHIQLLEVENKIRVLEAEGHTHDSPQMRALHLRRSKLAVRQAECTSGMSLLKLKQEWGELHSYIEANQQRPVPGQDLTALKRRKLALKDAIEEREREMQATLCETEVA